MMLVGKHYTLPLVCVAFLVLSVLAEIEPKITDRGIGSLSTSEIEEQLQVCYVRFQSGY